MYPIVWFAIMMALCVIYAERANVRWGPQQRFFIDWPHAIAIVFAIMLVGAFVAQNKNTSPSSSSTSTTQTIKGKPPKSTTTSTYAYRSSSSTSSKKHTKPKAKTYTEKKKEKEAKEKEEKEAKAKAAQLKARQQARTRAVTAFHAVGMTFAIFAALILWRQDAWYPYALALASMLVVVSYYWWPNQHELSNFVLIMVAIGFSLLGRTSTQKGFIVAYTILVLFDIYAVWGSDLMSRIGTFYPGVFPKYLTIDQYTGITGGFGAGDVIFSAIACNHIHQHVGIRRAGFFAIACTIGMVIGILMPGSTPLLIYVSPIAIATLLIPKGYLRID